jgi:hypothetical protein
LHGASETPHLRFGFTGAFAGDGVFVFFLAFMVGIAVGATVETVGVEVNFTVGNAAGVDDGGADGIPVSSLGSKQ